MNYTVFEGIDGSAKTTHSQALVERLKAAGHKAVWTREPGSPLIKLNVRDLVLSDEKIDPRALELLLQADRAEHTSKVKELMNQGYWVVSDRSFLSGVCYSTANKHDWEAIAKIMEFSIQVWPGRIFFLDIPVEEAERRRAKRDDKPTREEARGTEFTETVRSNFKKYAKLYAPTCPVTYLDGVLPKEQLIQHIDTVLRLV